MISPLTIVWKNLGQALGPFLVAFGSQKWFSGPTALASSFALWCGVFGTAMIASVWVLRRRLRADAADPAVFA